MSITENEILIDDITVSYSFFPELRTVLFFLSTDNSAIQMSHSVCQDNVVRPIDYRCDNVDVPVVNIEYSLGGAD